MVYFYKTLNHQHFVTACDPKQLRYMCSLVILRMFWEECFWYTRMGATAALSVTEMICDLDEVLAPSSGQRQ